MISFRTSLPSLDDCASLYSINTESWQDVSSVHSCDEGIQQHFLLDASSLSRPSQSILHYGTEIRAVRPPLDTPDPISASYIPGIHQDSENHCSLLAMPPVSQHLSTPLDQSIHTRSSRPFLQAWSTTNDTGQDFTWVPNHGSCLDWTAEQFNEQASIPMIEEDIKETGAMFHRPRIWMCRTQGCNKMFHKQHAFKYVRRRSIWFTILSDMI